MDDENQNDSLMMDAIKDLLTKDYTIEEAIELKKLEDQEVLNSFSVCREGYKSTLNYRRKIINTLLYIKLHLIMSKLVSVIKNNGLVELLDAVIEKVGNTNEKVIQQKDLLLNIKDAINILQKYQVSLCNEDICALLITINLLNNKMLLEVNDYIETSANAMKGIRYMSNKHYDDDINALEEIVEEYTLKLGLQNK